MDQFTKLIRSKSGSLYRCGKSECTRKFYFKVWTTCESLNFTRNPWVRGKNELLFPVCSSRPPLAVCIWLNCHNLWLWRCYRGDRDYFAYQCLQQLCGVEDFLSVSVVSGWAVFSQRPLYLEDAWVCGKATRRNKSKSCDENWSSASVTEIDELTLKSNEFDKGVFGKLPQAGNSLKSPQ